MANTYHSLNVHAIFSTKGRQPWITGEMEKRIWLYIGGMLRRNNMKFVCGGGTADHVHILMSLPTTISVAKAVQLIKGGSSKWVHETFPKLRVFRWQEGYSAFTVSASRIGDTIDYIRNQTDHHSKKTFQDEYVSFLKKNRVDYDERYLWK